MSAPAAKTNLLGLTRAGMEAFVAGMGEKPFRARQLMKWMYRRAVGDFDGMTDLGKDFRRRLAEIAEISVPEVITSQASADGTRKWLLRFESGQAVEMVFIPEPGRGTLCISSQVGCAMDCGFCSTGAQGFNRNLTTAEIVGQVWLANRELGYSPDGDRVITNVVFMGMGEPLANYGPVWTTVERLHRDLGLSARQITVSTVGVVPGMRRLATEALPVTLAVSLHAPDDALRSTLVPLNHRYPIAEVLDAAAEVAAAKGRRVTFEYAVIHGVNDGLDHAEALGALLAAWPGVGGAHVNLIPLNPTTGFSGKAPTPARVRAFAERAARPGVTVTVRRNRGVDIDAACGQLRSRARADAG